MDDARIAGMSAQENHGAKETIILRLTHAEAQFLEAQLARDLARIEDELVESGNAGAPALSRSAADLRQLDERLRELLAEEPLPGLL
jgi:hypothetical protein